MQNSCQRSIGCLMSLKRNLSFRRNSPCWRKCVTKSTPSLILMLLIGRARSYPRSSLVARQINHLFCSGRRHFESPDGCGAHVHSGAEISGDIPRFGCAEPVALAFVDHMIEAMGGLVCLIFHALAYQESGIPQRC